MNVPINCIRPCFLPADAPGRPLTPREEDVTGLIARGLQNKAIARELGIAPETAKVHVAHVLRKLGVNSRLQVAVWQLNRDRQ